MAIPRRLIVIAASAAVTGLVLYARNRMKDSKREEPRAPKPGAHDAAASPTAAQPTPTAAQPTRPSATPRTATAAAPSDATEAQPGEPAASGGVVRELSQFLAGETWHDEAGWKGLWAREAVSVPETWLRTSGKDVLAAERAKLARAPALLAGCRRRWIVVCRYAGLSVDDAASLWTSTDA